MLAQFVRLQHLIVLDAENNERDLRAILSAAADAHIEVDHVDHQEDGSCAIEVSHWIWSQHQITEIERVRQALPGQYCGSRALSVYDYQAEKHAA